MTELFIFAGTTEGRMLVDALSASAASGKFSVQVFTATEYGKEILEADGEQSRGQSGSAAVRIHAGRLTAEEMTARMMEHQPAYVIDCTHPHATEVTKNIREACEKANVPYLRLLRDAAAETEMEATTESVTDTEAAPVQVSNIDEAAAFLETKPGNILLTTGSKELEPFTIEALRSRTYIRLLPMEENLARCKALGFLPSQLICMQGPFSEDLNRALIRQYDIGFVVTKDSGEVGGAREKVRAAALEGARIVMVRRPKQEEGYSISEILSRLGCRPADSGFRKTVYLIGAGPGHPRLLTEEAREALAASACVIGAPRLLESAGPLLAGKETIALIRADEILRHIEESEAEHIAVLLSGDPGFYSGAKNLIAAFRENGQAFKVISGISSLVYFAGKIGVPWESLKVVSLHGRSVNIVESVSGGTFFLTDHITSAERICSLLTAAGLGDYEASIGENLSYEEEKITTGTAAELAGVHFASPHVVLVRRAS